MKYVFRARVVALFASSALAAPAAAVCASAACTTTTTAATYTPITGILIRSSALVAGFGCGTGPQQVYRYVAIVDYARADGGTPRDAAPAQADGPQWTNIFDCFADGVFENLPSSSTGSQAFDVSIFAYDKASYDKSGLPSDLGCLPGMTAAMAVCQSTPQVVAASVTAEAPWTTTCTATQQQGIPVLAVCSALSDAKTSAEDGGPDGGGAPDTGGAPDSAALEGGAPEAGSGDGSTGPGPGATSTDADTNG